MSLCISSCSGKNCKNSHLGGHNVSASGVSAASVLLRKPATTRGVLGVGIQGTPFQKLKSLRIWPTFESGHILRIQNPMSNLSGSRSGLNYFLLGKLPSNFQGSKSRWGKFPHFPQWWLRPWFRQLCFELNPESPFFCKMTIAVHAPLNPNHHHQPFFFYTSIHLDENMSNVTCYVTF